MKMKINLDKRTLLLLIILVTFHMLICAIIGFNREYMFTDEVYSYGLANSENCAFIDPGSNPTLYNWTPGSFFSGYLKFDDSVPFSFNAAFSNQAEDVHPPLYYCLLHLICSFFKNIVYSTVPGITLNIILVPFIDIILFYCIKYFTKSSFFAISGILLWGFSASGLSNVNLIRMYLLLTLLLMALIFLHIKYFIHFIGISNPSIITYLSYPLFTIIICLGGLTHYYFYIFAATLGFTTCLYLLSQKNFKGLIIYAISLWIGVLLAVLIFPSVFQHLFGYRGGYALKSIGGISPDKIKTYLTYINNSLLGGFFIIIFAALILIKFSTLFFKIKDFSNGVLSLEFTSKKAPLRKQTIIFQISRLNWLLIFIIFSTICFAYISIQGSEIISSRYIYPIFPILTMLIMVLLNILFKWKTFTKLFLIAVIAFIDLLSIKNNGIDYLYSDYSEVTGSSDLEGYDCIIYCKDGAWVNVLQGINQYINMDEVCCVFERQIEDVSSIINARNTKNKLCVAFYSDAGYTDEQRRYILNQIVDKLNYKSFSLEYDYYTKIYRLE